MHAVWARDWSFLGHYLAFVQKFGIAALRLASASLFALFSLATASGVVIVSPSFWIWSSAVTPSLRTHALPPIASVTTAVPILVIGSDFFANSLSLGTPFHFVPSLVLFFLLYFPPLLLE